MTPMILAGLGAYAPRENRSSQALDAVFGQSAGWTEAQFGIASRGVAGPDETTSMMGAEAARRALAMAGWSDGTFDVLIGACAVMEQPIPGASVLIQDALGLGRSGIWAFDVNQTCLSFVAALDVPAPERGERLRAFAPDVLIAPTQVLADLARRTDGPWALRRLFYGAEPMGERGWIAAALGVRPDPIYQATEGFLGATCRFGTLHLNEDVLVIEREPVPGTDRFLPIITDLRRTTQPMIRVRLADLLEPLAAPCPCGSPLLAVHPVEGRLEDLWRRPAGVLCPREVETAVSAALGPDSDWRAVASPRAVTIEAEPDRIETARVAVQALLASRRLDVPVKIGGPPGRDGVKRRRVRWFDG